MEAKKTRKIDLLTAIEKIVELAKDSQLSAEFYCKANRYIKYVSDKMDLTKEQSVMLALFVDNSSDETIRISDFGEYLGCRTTRIIRYMNDIDVLEQREFIRCCRNRSRFDRSISYRMPFPVIDAIKRDEKYTPQRLTGLTCQELFSELEDIFELRSDKEITYEMMVQQIESLFEDNSQLHYVQCVKEKCTCDEDLVLMVFFSHLYVNNNDNNIGFHDLEFLFEYKRTLNRIKRFFNIGKHFLFEIKFIENNNDDGMLDRESFRLTQNAKDEYLKELGIQAKFQNSIGAGLIKAEKIAEKKLFYSESVQSQINELYQLMDKEHYQNIIRRMKDAGFRCGFTCLFYGAPGTGKTETVLQLARQTGRDLMQVDISKIKSCWVGESEKNIKSLFDAYRYRARESSLTPILLFNEADAIINQRMEGAQTAVNKMENSIQNIILQELENLDGILIATTNLVQNMDKAFERRFLYKLKFEKPTLEARSHIWHEMIPALSVSDSNILAERYPFSGGQIENTSWQRCQYHRNTHRLLRK